MKGINLDKKSPSLVILYFSVLALLDRGGVLHIMPTVVNRRNLKINPEFFKKRGEDFFFFFFFDKSAGRNHLEDSAGFT